MNLLGLGRLSLDRGWGGSPAIPSNGLLAGLAAYWALNNASGSRPDSFSTNNLTDNNTVTSTAGLLDTVAQFTAANSEYLSILDAAQVGLDASTAQTVSVWARLDTMTAICALTSKYSYAGGVGQIAWEISDDGHIQAYVFSDSNDYRSATGLITTGQFYHLAYVYDGSLTGNSNRFKVYLNGTLLVPTNIFGTIPATLAPSGSKFTIGTFEGLGRYMNGKMGHVAVWNAAKSAANITTLYNAGTVLPLASFT